MDLYYCYYKEAHGALLGQAVARLTTDGRGLIVQHLPSLREAILKDDQLTRFALLSPQEDEEGLPFIKLTTCLLVASGGEQVTRTLFEHSYNLLEEEEREEVLTRLTVFFAQSKAAF